MRITPAIELEHRCKRLQEGMAAEGLDAIIIVQNADLFYFTGTVQNGSLYVPAQGQPLYMVRRDMARARMESGLKEVLPFQSMKDIPNLLAQYGYSQPSRIGMELDVLPVNLFERYRQVFAGAVFTDASPLIRKVRMIKSHYEIHIMKDAADQVYKVNSQVAEFLREGMSELELAAELERAARREGHLGLLRMRVFNGEMFIGHTFSGTDSAVPAYIDTPLGGMGLTPSFGQGASWKRIGRNEPVIVDFSGSFDGYLVDQTRVFVIGSLSDRLRRGYDDMIKVQERMISLMKERPTWGAVYDDCLDLACRMGYEDHFMGNKGAQVSFIGHGLGVEIDEYPFIAKGFYDMPIETGMAFAFEPKVVFPGEGAVGIENTFYMSEEGLKRLTYSDEKISAL